MARLELMLLVGCVSTWARGARLPPAEWGMPTECAGLDWCTTPHELYPAPLVEQLLQRANLSFAGAGGVEQRAGPEEERDCPVLTSEEPIYEIVDSAGRVRVVLQAGPALQRVRLERCAAPGRLRRASAHFPRRLLAAHNLQCVQRQLDVPFLALSPDWTAIEMVRVKTGVPVRCDCSLYPLQH